MYDTPTRFDMEYEPLPELDLCAPAAPGKRPAVPHEEAPGGLTTILLIGCAAMSAIAVLMVAMLVMG